MFGLESDEWVIFTIHPDDFNISQTGMSQDKPIPFKVIGQLGMSPMDLGYMVGQITEALADNRGTDRDDYSGAIGGELV